MDSYNYDLKHDALRDFLKNYKRNRDKDKKTNKPFTLRLASRRHPHGNWLPRRSTETEGRAVSALISSRPPVHEPHNSFPANFAWARSRKIVFWSAPRGYPNRSRRPPRIHLYWLQDMNVPTSVWFRTELGRSWNQAVVQISKLLWDDTNNDPLLLNSQHTMADKQP